MLRSLLPGLAPPQQEARPSSWGTGNPEAAFASRMEINQNPASDWQQKSGKKRKSVSWAQPERLESVKYFKMNDEPSAPGLNMDEVMEIQKHLADVPAHMIPSELQKIEMKLDRKLLEEKKGLESQLRSKLDAMKPLVRFSRQLMRKCPLLTPLAVFRGEAFALSNGEKSTEAATQKAREADKFSYYAREGQAIPNNPLRELDELYSKDAKVPHIDLEGFAKEHLKSLEESKFNDDMTQLQKELDSLESGKSSHPPQPSARPVTSPCLPLQSPARLHRIWSAQPVLSRHAPVDNLRSLPSYRQSLRLLSTP